MKRKSILFVGIALSLFTVWSVIAAGNAGTPTFKISTWNTEWLSCTQNGPTDEALQLDNVAAVIKLLNSDLVALQEVGTTSASPTLDLLVQKLGSEWEGRILPTSVDNCGQNQAIVYKKSKIQFVSASVITNGGTSYNWSSGRYPILYNINFLNGTNTMPVALINIHSKAMSDPTSYSRRKSSSASLKLLLDGNLYNTQNIILLGDFNDYLIGTQCSTCTDVDSPYKNFMDDPVNYKGLTSALYDPKYSSKVIDNIVISNELFDNYNPTSVIREEAVTQQIPNYTNTTSDHTPISTTFTFEGSVPNSCTNVSVLETFTESLGEFTAYNVSGNQLWASNSLYGAVISGYTAGANNVNEDWLISPAYDLSGMGSATVNFNHAINYSTIESERLQNHSLWVSTIYSSGNLPSSAGWTKLTIPTMPAGNSWTFTASGDINIPQQFLAANVRFAFKYLSSATTASTWEVKNYTLNGVCKTTDVKSPVQKNKARVWASNGAIYIESASESPVTVYTTSGQQIACLPKTTSTVLHISKKGLYLVKVAENVFKVSNY